MALKAPKRSQPHTPNPQTNINNDVQGNSTRAMEVTKRYKFIRFGAMEVTKPCKFIWFGAMEVTKPYKFIGFGANHLSNPP
jgi:hypothetical protein